MTDWKEEGWNFENQHQSSRQPKKDNDQPVHFRVVEHIAILSENEKGWRKELNLVSWNDSEPKYDIRSWKDDYSQVGKGVTLFEDEIIILGKVLQQLPFMEKKKEE
ncbi:hypothetical protein FKX92_03215 [Streptococcus sanguinis]|uniref:Uncharacterized protein n=1 Tax=Streptococcus sanguinis TaxID=1305 RepID=A0A5A7ZUP9_STRSA|nr:PC4/YdbC family ssDNA-binding protein [Streptococcus sanguinis]KAA0119559.1 hypothetical protein FKX92_03215 [Streptococcus sanguinis]